MTSAPSSDPKGKAQKSGSESSQGGTAVTAVGLEEKMHKFWADHRQHVTYACIAVLLVILGKGAWDKLAEVRENNLQAEFTAATASPAKLASFADQYSAHALGGVAYLTLADQKYEAGDFVQAAGFYRKATTAISFPTLAGRARLGEAVSNLNAGNRAAGETTLKAIAADTSLLKVTRAEAYYHLASLAAEASKADEVRKMVEELGKIDASGMWSQRATLLLVSLPAEEKKADAASSSGLTLKPAGK